MMLFEKKRRKRTFSFFFQACTQYLRPAVQLQSQIQALRV
jgi:hypothetical protein